MKTFFFLGKHYIQNKKSLQSLLFAIFPYNYSTCDVNI
jgi:hypothetical protein